MGFLPHCYPRDFRDYLAAKIGTRRWVIAPHLTPRLKARGYELAIPLETFATICQAYRTAEEGE
jgi:hypothetical protein